jgi:mRNA export factor
MLELEQNVGIFLGARDTLLKVFLAFPAAPGPISTTAFNHNGTVLAYAVSYDWSKGHGGMNGQQVNKIMLHPVQDEEVKKRQRNP